MTRQRTSSWLLPRECRCTQAQIKAYVAGIAPLAAFLPVRIDVEPISIGSLRSNAHRATNPQGVPMDLEHYAEGPFDEGDPRNEIALSVEVERGVVTAKEWNVVVADDPREAVQISYQAFSMRLGDLLNPKGIWRGSYSGDEGWSLADVQRMSKGEREDAVVAVAISRLAYGPNDERIVDELGGD